VQKETALVLSIYSSPSISTSDWFQDLCPSPHPPQIPNPRMLKSLMLNGVVKKMNKDYKNNGNVKWNFTKFLIDRDGNIVSRFEPTNMKNLKEKIKECL